MPYDEKVIDLTLDVSSDEEEDEEPPGRVGRVLETHGPVQLIINGDPMAMPRPRVARKGGVYYGKKVTVAKTDISNRIKAAMDGVVPFKKGVPVKMHITAFMKRPLYHFVNRTRDVNKLKHNYKSAFIMRHAIRKDVDNIAKFYMDAGNKTLYDDDCQVVAVTASKAYHTEGECNGQVCIYLSDMDSGL